jgi:hypothetical protein
MGVVMVVDNEMPFTLLTGYKRASHNPPNIYTGLTLRTLIDFVSIFLRASAYNTVLEVVKK